LLLLQMVDANTALAMFEPIVHFPMNHQGFDGIETSSIPPALCFRRP
jgi:hypothetical protein